MLYFCLFLCFILSDNSNYEVEMESMTRWEPIRIYFDINLGDENKNAILKQTTDSIAEYLKKVLKVHPCKYIKTKAGKYFTDKTYNNIDFLVAILALEEGDDASASTQSYTDRDNDFRSKASAIRIDKKVVDSPSVFTDSPRNLFNVIIHEVFHALGLAEGIFQYWIDPETNKRFIDLQRMPTHTCHFAGINREFTFLSTKTIKEYIKKKYGNDNFGLDVDGKICEAGIELEDDGGEGSKGKHPESRIFPFEIMTAIQTANKQYYISDLTLMLLNATGYYQVNMDMAEQYKFGDPDTNYGKPMDKFLVGVPAKSWPDQYQCNPERYNYPNTSINWQVCNPDLRGLSLCQRNQYICPQHADICSDLDFIDPYRTGYSGTESSFDYISFPVPKQLCSQTSSEVDIKRYGSTNGESSVCLVSSVRNADVGLSPNGLSGRCYNIQCDSTYSSYTVTLSDGSTGQCSHKGQNLTFPNSKFNLGYIECNDPYWTCYASNKYTPPEGTDPSESTQAEESSASSRSIETLPVATPEATPVPEATPIPEATPVPDQGPSGNEGIYTADGSVVRFTAEGFIDGDKEETKTTDSKSDIILIKATRNAVTLYADTQRAPLQDRYVSLQQRGAIVTIGYLENGTFGKGQFGIDPNSMDPTVRLPASIVPLNLYSNASNTITLQMMNRDENQESVELRKIIAQRGSLDVRAPSSVKEIVVDEVSAYNNAQVTSSSRLKVNKLTLNQGSNFGVSNVFVNSKLTTKPGAKLTVSEKVEFNNESVISLSHMSSVNLTDSQIVGVCGSISVHMDAQPQSSEQTEGDEKLICGENFVCSEWLKKFKPSNDFNRAECVNTSYGHECLVAFKNIDNGGKSNKKTVVIAVVVVVVIVVVVAVVVAVVFILKKKKSSESSTMFSSMM